VQDGGAAEGEGVGEGGAAVGVFLGGDAGGYWLCVAVRVSLIMSCLVLLECCEGDEPSERERERERDSFLGGQRGTRIG
jgi:hypothetical protein